MTARHRTTRAKAYQRGRLNGRSDLGLIALFAIFLSIAGLGWQRIGLAASQLSAASPTAARPSSATPPTARPSAVPTAVPTSGPTAEVVAGPADVNLFADSSPYFVSEVTNKLCAAAAAQMTVSMLTGSIDVSKETQLEIHSLEVQLTTELDSHNGGAGPDGIAAAITIRSGVAYEVRIYGSRATALRAAAVAIEATGDPAVLFVWRGAHNWVMTGFRSTADPMVDPAATVLGAYVLDPWYPRVSRIWGRSDGPGVFQDAAEMVRNFLPWKRPEGSYPGRDGKFLILVPVSAPA